MKREQAIGIVNELISDTKLSEAIVDSLIDGGIIQAEYGNADINRVAQAFKDAFGTTKVSRYDRYAAKRLIVRHGVENIEKVIQVLASKTDYEFAPVVRSIYQLEEKWIPVIRFLKKTQNRTIEL